MDALLEATFHIHHSELTAAVGDRWGWKYNFFTTGHPENARIEYVANGVYNAEQGQELREGERVRDPNLILNVLAADGLIPMGKYVVWTRAEMPKGVGYSFEGLNIRGQLV